LKILALFEIFSTFLRKNLRKPHEKYIFSERFVQAKGIASIPLAYCAPLLSALSARAHQSEPPV
jgi:hypothetical protein